MVPITSNCMTTFERKTKNMNRSHLTFLATALLNLACVGQTDATVGSEEAGAASDELIGGTAANAPLFDAVGAVFGGADAGREFCTATLIAPDQILGTTACVSTNGGATKFRIGPNALRPKQTIDIRAWTAVQPGLWEDRLPDGGLAPSALTSGIAIGYLAQPAQGVRPLKVGSFSREDLGKRFPVLGFGEQSDRPTLPPDAGDTRPGSVTNARRVGFMTLRALEGDRFWETQYRTFEEYVMADAILDKDPALASDPAYIAKHRITWERRLTDADSVLGGGPRDAKAAGGDSGGPIIAVVNGQLTILGLVSNWRYLGPRPAPFNFAWVPVLAATFGHEATYFINSRAACGTVDALGSCEGQTIVRCTTPNEGAPQIVSTPCGDLGMNCTSFGTTFFVPNAPLQCVPPCETDAECVGYTRAPGTCVASRCTWASVP